MARGLAVFLLLCLSVQPVFASNINWQKRVQGFTRYVEEQAVAQGRRTRGLEMQAKDYQRRVQGYVRALEARGRAAHSSGNP